MVWKVFSLMVGGVCITLYNTLELVRALMLAIGTVIVRFDE